MKSHCRRSATALDQALSMDGYPHSSTLLDTKNVSKRIKPSIIIVCGPCTNMSSSWFAFCPSWGSKATQTACDSRRHSSVPSLWARRWSDRTFPSWPNAPGQASKRLETLETPSQRSQRAKGKAIDTFQVFPGTVFTDIHWSHGMAPKHPWSRVGAAESPFGDKKWTDWETSGATRRQKEMKRL